MQIVRHVLRKILIIITIIIIIGLFSLKFKSLIWSRLKIFTMQPFVPAIFIGGILMTHIVQFLKKKVRRRLEYPGLIEKKKICSSCT